MGSEHVMKATLAKLILLVLAVTVTGIEAQQRLSGQVVDAATGKVVKAPVIEVRRLTNQRRNASEVIPVDANASFSFPLSSDVKFVRVSAEGYVPRTYSIADLRSEGLNKLALDAGEVVVGQLLDDKSDRPVEGDVMLTSGQRNQEMASIRSGPDGYFSHRVAAGSVRVLARAEGYSTTQRTVSVPAAAPLVFRLKRNAQLEGRIETAAGDGVPNAKLRFRPLELGSPVWIEAISKPDGSFVVLNLAADVAYEVLFVAAGCDALPVSRVRLAAGEQRRDYRLVAPSCPAAD
jgi:hypothetical protein